MPERTIAIVDGQETEVSEPQAQDIQLLDRHGADPTYCICCRTNLKGPDGVLRAHEAVTTERGLAVLVACPTCGCDNVLRPRISGPTLVVDAPSDAGDAS